MDKVLAGDFWPQNPRGVSAHRRTCYPTNQSARLRIRRSTPNEPCRCPWDLEPREIEAAPPLSAPRLLHPLAVPSACVRRRYLAARGPLPGCQRTVTWLTREPVRYRIARTNEDNRGCPRRVRACQGVRCARDHNGFSFERN